jgi:hypothetical protein
MRDATEGGDVLLTTQSGAFTLLSDIPLLLFPANASSLPN